MAVVFSCGNVKLSYCLLLYVPQDRYIVQNHGPFSRYILIISASACILSSIWIYSKTIGIGGNSVNILR